MFEFTISVKAGSAAGSADFSGPIVQGPRGGRFVYVDIGTLAGQPDTPWTRRLKVPLAGLTSGLIRRASSSANGAVRSAGARDRQGRQPELRERQGLRGVDKFLRACRIVDCCQLVIVALQVSILSTVFGFGLKTTSEDMLYLVRRPGLLVRSLISVFLIVPLVAVVLDVVFDFRRTLEVVFVSLSLSPVPPLLPIKESKAGGQRSYTLGLMALLALLSIGSCPLAMALIGFVFGRSFGMGPGAIARVAVISVILPLVAGITVRALLPGVADRLDKLSARSRRSCCHWPRWCSSSEAGAPCGPPSETAASSRLSSSSPRTTRRASPGRAGSGTCRRARALECRDPAIALADRRRKLSRRFPWRVAPAAVCRRQTR